MQKSLSLTPNHRMAAFLHPRFPSTKVLALSAWLEALYEALVTKDPNTSTCLSPHESRVLWEQIVRASIVGQEMLHVSSIAALAYEAWGLCTQWRLQEKGNVFGASQDSRLYQQWSVAYQDELRQRHCVDSFGFVDYLIASIRQSSLDRLLPEQIDWIGFQEIIPHYAELQEALQSRGVQIRTSTLEPRQGVAYSVAVSDPLQGVRMAAHYAKQCVFDAQGSSGTRSQASPAQIRIGIVIPDLAAQRERVVSVFSRILPQGSFKVSGPPSLLSYPLIDAAFFGLSLARGRISLEAISRFLRSPFFGDCTIEAMQQRAAFDAYLRELNQADFNFEELEAIYLERSETPPSFPRTRESSGNNSTHHWSEWMQQWLKMLGWPGTRLLNETEKALVTAFETLFASYIALDSVLGTHTYEKAYVECKTLAQSTPFLPSDVDENAPIQVLGLLEAAGLRFDKLWIMGMNHNQWPPSPKPNPFIPLHLQRQHHLPRSSVEREDRVASALVEDFCQSADTVIFSYAMMLDDQEGKISPLLKGLPERTLASLGLDQIPSYLGSLARYQPFDQSFAEKGPAIPLPSLIKGGARALQLQSLCPFRSFAETRLLARPLKSCSVGLSAAERGILVHKALEYFWKKIKTQRQLLSLPDPTLKDHLKKAIDKACAKFETSHYFQGIYRHLEEKRLFDRLYAFIVHEKKRPSFEVLAVEKSQTLDFQGLQFEVRIDRIDRIHSIDRTHDIEGIHGTKGQEEVLIDYKTGKTTIADWFGPRPRDLQLPLYAVGRSLQSSTEITKTNGKAEAPVALAFGGLHPYQIGFKGISKASLGWSGVKAIEDLSASLPSEKDWTQQMIAWKISTEHLASAFTSGVANVDPLEGAKTCRHCALKTLCRVVHS